MTVRPDVETFLNSSGITQKGNCRNRKRSKRLRLVTALKHCTVLVQDALVLSSKPRWSSCPLVERSSPKLCARNISSCSVSRIRASDSVSRGLLVGSFLLLRARNPTDDCHNDGPADASAADAGKEVSQVARVYRARSYA